MTAILALLLAGPGDLTEAEFRKLHEQLRPTGTEAWRSIPWKVSLVEAQNAAARERKPLFIWSMDGNPLGCG
jgi:hypothetical protein